MRAGSFIGRAPKANAEEGRGSRGWRGHLALACGAAAAVVCLMGCMELPRRAAERGLYIDARKVVEVNERLGWEIDRHEIEEAVPTLLPSVCRSTIEDRLAVQRYVQARIDAAGGPARAQYFENGRDLSAIQPVLRLERTRDLLRAAGDAAEADCPFWMEPDPEFHAIHGAGRRLTFVLESRGAAGLVFRGEDVALGGTGSGRVLLSFGLGDRLTLAVGGELGGVAAFPENAEGNRTLQGNFAGAVPVLLRIYNGLSVIDVEAAPAFRYKNEAILGPGLRGSVGYGISALRGATLMPHAVLWVGYEWQPPRSGNPAEHGLRIGTKVGFNWDPS